MHRSPFGLRTPKDSNAFAGIYFAARSAYLAFTGHRAESPSSMKRKAHMTTPSLLIRKARPSMSSSSWLESSRKSPSLGNTASTTCAYSSRARAFRKRKNLPLQSLTGQQDAKPKSEPKLSSKKSAALRKRWAQLIKRVHQTDPLQCDCGGTYRVIAFITEQKVIRKILANLEKIKRKRDSRPPPEP